MKKSHPIRRTLLATAATVSGIVLLLSLKPASDAGSVQAGAAGGAPSAQGGVAAGAQTLTGSAVTTDYGPVQVRITVNGGKITGAEAVQQPSGGRSTQISGDAIPKLNQAAVAAGSADIDAVSGATYTSAGYKESLQSALDQAGKAQDSGAQVLTGTTVQTDYGPVQVRITVSGGKITAAEAVQAPSGGRSTQITADSVPKLNQAAVAAGSADIDAVSGATYTSAGYKESLQSALDQAGKAQDSGTEVEAGGSQDAGGDAEGTEDSGAGQSTGTQVLTGSAIKTDYGPVQVRVTVTDGRITAAEALQQPTGGRSTQISGTAIPQLNKNAVSAGSADIDAVSGATYTSGGYQQSLQSALDQAG
ncbi:FMN-binding protein [Streptomyces europaeiscabiei]|uniref:FMN-binding protein n=1 Tax=Streptomyces europaeiscabiei TaxID=146819 RepID=A0AAJ2UKD1_9ACTN|nr:FMN-binding protein [Streptomyces europaeiscabiei]MDX3129496.1 FMN-binding protein [Streptomyces europaeiscabiei]